MEYYVKEFYVTHSTVYTGAEYTYACVRRIEHNPNVTQLKLAPCCVYWCYLSSDISTILSFNSLHLSPVSGSLSSLNSLFLSKHLIHFLLHIMFLAKHLQKHFTGPENKVPDITEKNKVPVGFPGVPRVY